MWRVGSLALDFWFCKALLARTHFMVPQEHSGSHNMLGSSIIFWLAHPTGFFMDIVARIHPMVPQTLCGSHRLPGSSDTNWLALCVWFFKGSMARSCWMVLHGGFGSHYLTGSTCPLWLARVSWFFMRGLAHPSRSSPTGRCTLHAPGGRSRRPCWIPAPRCYATPPTGATGIS